MAHQTGNELMRALSKRYQDGQYWDVEITCGDTRYRGHKIIVCSLSQFFARLCAGEAGRGLHTEYGFREPRQLAWVGATHNVIPLPDDDPTAVRLMMHYFYHLDYPYIPRSGGVFDLNAIDILPCSEKKAKNKKKKKITRLNDAAWLGKAELELPLVEPEVQAEAVHEAYLEVEPEAEADLAVEERPKAVHDTEVEVEPALAEEPVHDYWAPTEPATESRPEDEPELEPAAPATVSEPEPPVLFESRETNLTLHAMVYALAEKYTVDGLKDVALSKFRAELDTNWDTSDFLEAIDIVYKSTPESDRDMRNVVVGVTHDNKLLDQPVFKEYVRGTGNFQLVFDLLMYGH